MAWVVMCGQTVKLQFIGASEPSNAGLLSCSSSPLVQPSTFHSLVISASGDARFVTLASVSSMADVAEQPIAAAATDSVVQPNANSTSAPLPAPSASLFKRKSHKQAAARKPLSLALKDEEDADDKADPIESAPTPPLLTSPHLTSPTLSHISCGRWLC